MSVYLRANWVHSSPLSLVLISSLIRPPRSQAKTSLIMVTMTSMIASNSTVPSRSARAPRIDIVSKRLPETCTLPRSSSKDRQTMLCQRPRPSPTSNSLNLTYQEDSQPLEASTRLRTSTRELMFKAWSTLTPCKPLQSKTITLVMASRQARPALQLRCSRDSYRRSLAPPWPASKEALESLRRASAKTNKSLKLTSKWELWLELWDNEESERIPYDALKQLSWSV